MHAIRAQKTAKPTTKEQSSTSTNKFTLARNTKSPFFIMKLALTTSKIIKQSNYANQVHMSEFISYVSSQIKSSGDKQSTHSPISCKFYVPRRSMKGQSINSFSALKFYKILSAWWELVSQNCTVGGRRQSAYSGNNMLFMLLCFLNYGLQWDSTVRLFKTSSHLVERQATKYLLFTMEHISEKLVF